LRPMGYARCTGGHFAWVEVPGAFSKARKDSVSIWVGGSCEAPP
jgi:hypothetical protein